jgi:DNA polymerase-3 subunit delta'
LCQKTQYETISFFSDNKTSGFLNHCKRSNGDLGNLYNYNEDLENQDNFIENFSSLMRVCFKNNIVEISSWVDQVSVKTRENQIKIISYSISLMRECIIYNFSDKKINNLSEKEAKFIKNFSSYIHEENSLHIISIFESIIKNIQRNANSKIILFDMSLRLVKLLKLKRKFV